MLEVVIVGQRLGDAVAVHNLERGTIRMTPSLVASLSIKRERFLELRTGLGNDKDVGIFLEILDETYGGAQPFFLMGQLRWAAEKMPRARLKHAIDAVFRTDEAIKLSGGDPKVLLERLVVELCGPAQAGTR